MAGLVGLLAMLGVGVWDPIANRGRVVVFFEVCLVPDPMLFCVVVGMENGSH